MTEEGFAILGNRARFSPLLELAALSL